MIDITELFKDLRYKLVNILVRTVWDTTDEEWSVIFNIIKEIEERCV